MLFRILLPDWRLPSWVCLFVWLPKHLCWSEAQYCMNGLMRLSPFVHPPAPFILLLQQPAHMALAKPSSERALIYTHSASHVSLPYCLVGVHPAIALHFPIPGSGAIAANSKGHCIGSSVSTLEIHRLMTVESCQVHYTVFCTEICRRTYVCTHVCKCKSFTSHIPSENCT